MKKITVIFLIIFTALNIFGQNIDKNLTRIKIAVVPSKDGKVYTSMVERALGSDKRFDFLDQSKIPQILEEWERRQAGITENDDTADLALKNIDFLVELANVQINSEKQYDEATDEQKIMIATGLMSQEDLAKYQVIIRADLKITDISESQSTQTKSFSASSTDKKQLTAQTNAINSLENSIQSSIKTLFPIKALIADITYSSIKILRGENSGIKKGQRFVLKEEKKTTINGKEFTARRNAGFVQVTEVNDEYSDAYIVTAKSGLNADNLKAVEKFYAGVSFELDGGMLMTDTTEEIDHNFGDTDLFGGFDLLFGKSFQFGLGMQFAGNDGYFRMSFPDLQLRYNLHVIRRLFLNLAVLGNVEFASKNTTLVVKNNSATANLYGSTVINDEKIRVSGMAFSGTLLAGFKFHMSYSTYFFTQAGYTFATKYNWSYTAPKDTTDQLKIDSISDYNDYMPSYRSAGPTLRFGIGFNF
ncbi:MAG: hypothetical protein JW982_09550 [Spirochaetes bacterium]|nr:hypothetical protein [Spirochaetota bacterium]